MPEKLLQQPAQGRMERLRRNYYLKAFLYGLGISFCFFLPFIAVNKGYFLFYGDFNVQQVPFYQMCHDAIRSGNIRWSWTTDLGANFVGSYSFYLLGSPFFWLTLPFPSDAVPYLMGPLFMLKFGCACLTGYIFLQRYAKSKQVALLGAMLYAFSGFSVYNIFFNHFHEAIIAFPLLLAALDAYMYERRRGVFALAVFACCFVNYYFFVGQVVFTLIYWFVRMFSKSWRINAKNFFFLLLEAVLGVMMSAVLLVPSIYAVIQNYRVNNPLSDWNMLLYNKNQRYIHIIECFFFPPDIPARPNFTPDSESKWASLGAWLPLFSMSGVIAWLQIRKKSWLKKLLWICFFMAMIPVLNSSFQLFNASYYARWYYMLTLIMSLATVFALENAQTDWKRSIRWTLLLTLAIALPIGLIPATSGDNGITLGLEKYPTRFWSYVAIAVASLFLLLLLFKIYQGKREQFHRALAGGIAFVTVVYAAFFISLGKTQSEDPDTFLIPYQLNGGEDLDLPGDLQNVRSDFYDSLDNSAMFWQIPSIQAFHSIVPGSVMEFYPTIGVTRDVGSRPKTDCYALRALTSCRWLFDDTHDSEFFGGSDKAAPSMPGWTYYATQNGFDVWENDYYIPMGFSYDAYITRSAYDAMTESRRDNLLIKALVLSDEQAAKYSNLLYELDTSAYSYTEEEYFEDCTARRSMCCSAFSHDNTGFSATFTSEKERLVFFSVPYESGWSATVNGQQVEVENVSVGFMAVVVPAGTSEIRFEYETPGLKLGLLISLAGLAVFLLYFFLSKHVRRKNLLKKRPETHFHLVSLTQYEADAACQFTGLIKTKEKRKDS